MIYRDWITLLRWAGGEEFLRKLAIEHNVDITTTKTKGLIRETIYYVVQGEEKDLIKFKNSVYISIREYNKD